MSEHQYDIDEDETYGLLPAPPPPPTERDGIRVGDQITLVTHTGAQYPVRVLRFFAALSCCMVVEWLGLRPLTALHPSGQTTVCRGDLREIKQQSPGGSW